MKRKSIAHRFLFRLCPSHRFLIAFPLLLVVNAAQSASANPPQTTREGKVTRENFDLYYTIVGSGGPYVVILSGGPGEEVRSMQAFADELSKNDQCSNFFHKWFHDYIFKFREMDKLNWR